MPALLLERRVASLEDQVNAFNQLPGRVDAMEGQLLDVRRNLAALRDEMRSEFISMRAEIRAGDEETRRHMRVLHEEVISRIAMLQEGTATAIVPRQRSRGRRKSKRR